MTPRSKPSPIWMGAALAALACTSAHPPSTSRSTSMSNQQQDQNKKNVEKLFATFGNGDLAALEELVAPEYVGPQGNKGPAGFHTVIVGLRGAFPDIHYTVDEMVAEGESVAVRWHWNGTHRGQFRGYAPTGKTVS